MAVGDGRLARVEPVDDRLGQDVAEQVVGALSLGVQLAPQPFEQARVRVADLLDLAEGLLDPPHAPREASVLLANVVGAALGIGAGLVGHVPRRSVVKVSLKNRLEPVPRTGPISP